MKVRCKECGEFFEYHNSDNMITAEKYNDILEKRGDKRIHFKGLVPKESYFLCNECLTGNGDK